MEMPLCFGIGRGEAMKRRARERGGDSLHGGVGSPKDSAIFSNAGMCLTSSGKSAEAAEAAEKRGYHSRAK